MAINTHTQVTTYRPEPICDDCDQVILGSIHPVGIERLCRHCHTTRYPKSTAPILGCRAVHLEAPCIVTPPPPQPLPPAPATTPPVIATSPPAVAPKPARTPKPPPAKPAPKRRIRPHHLAAVALADGPMRPSALADALGIRRDNVVARLSPAIANGIIQRTRGWYHLPGQEAPAKAARGQHNGITAQIRDALTEPMTLTELAARTGLPLHTVRGSMHNAGAECCEQRPGRGRVGVWRLKVP